MINNISEIQFTPIKPQKGLVAFVSLIIDNGLYLSSIGIVTRPQGGYRLLYPTKKNLDKNFSIFHPISKEFGKYIEEVVINEYKKVMKENDRHSGINGTSNKKTYSFTS